MSKKGKQGLRKIPRMVLISQGSFTLGALENDTEAQDL